MLGIAYACNIGGMGTLVGTFPNAVFAGMLPDLIPGAEAPDFLGWMLKGIPLVLILVPVAWLLLTRVMFPLPGAVGQGEGIQAIRQERRGLGVGADDYVTKPFGVRELVARVEALGRRAEASGGLTGDLEIDGCRIDLGRCVARRGDQRTTLTAREASILRALHRHRSRAVTRAELLETVWGARGDLQTRTVDMTIANLRQKIERDPSSPSIVVTVKGVGYAWGRR